MACPRCSSSQITWQQVQTPDGEMTQYRCSRCGTVWLDDGREAQAWEARRSVPIYRRPWFWVVVLFSVVVFWRSVSTGGKNAPLPVQSNSSAAQKPATAAAQNPAASASFVLDADSVTSSGPVSTPGLKLFSGELLGVNSDGDGTFVVKARAVGATNKLMIAAAFHNVEHLITEHGFDSCKELQYWAVARSMDGDDVKYISFTVPEDLIAQIAAGKVVAIQLRDLVEDLWVLPGME